MPRHALNVLRCALLATLPCGCAPRAPDAPAAATLERSTTVMGTRLSVSARAPDSASAEAAVEAALRAVARVDSLMSTYKPESELSRMARAAGSGAWTELSPETGAVLAAALDWARRSGGAFDPTVGPLMEAWGFRGDQPRRPDDAALAAARARVGWQGVQVDSARARARLTRGDAQLDFGAIAKGYALDRALAALRAQGATAGMVDLGGNLSVFGPPLSGRDAWVLGIRHPRAPGALLGTIAVDSGSISTSGDYEQMFEEGGVRYGHIMDPTAGEPARGVVAVTVVAPDGMTGDALSTLLFVLGPERGRAFLERELPGAPITAVWVRDPGPAELTRAHVVLAGPTERLELELPEGGAP